MGSIEADVCQYMYSCKVFDNYTQRTLCVRTFAPLQPQQKTATIFSPQFVQFLATICQIHKLLLCSQLVYFKRTHFKHFYSPNLQGCLLFRNLSKDVNLVHLIKCCPISVRSRKLASIQRSHATPRTSPSNFYHTSHKKAAIICRADVPDCSSFCFQEICVCSPILLPSCSPIFCIKRCLSKMFTVYRHMKSCSNICRSTSLNSGMKASYLSSHE